MPDATSPHLATHRNDADLILAVVRATAEWEGDTQAIAVVKPIRELIWAVWEKPRLGDTVRSKYTVAVQWSRAARKSYRADPKPGLVLEHVTPMNLIVRDLLRKPPANVAALVRLLYRRIEYAVITPEENRRFSDARVAGKLAPGSSDGWDRYKVAKLDVDGFAPLNG